MFERPYLIKQLSDETINGLSDCADILFLPNTDQRNSLHFSYLTKNDLQVEKNIFTRDVFEQGRVCAVLFSFFREGNPEVGFKLSSIERTSRVETLSFFSS